RKFADAVFLERAVWFARFVGVAENADEKLVNAHALVRIKSPANLDGKSLCGLRRFFRQRNLEVVRHIFVIDSIRDACIAASVKLSPAIVFAQVLRIYDKAKFFWASEFRKI